MEEKKKKLKSNFQSIYYVDLPSCSILQPSYDMRRKYSFQGSSKYHHDNTQEGEMGCDLDFFFFFFILKISLRIYYLNENKRINWLKAHKLMSIFAIFLSHDDDTVLMKFQRFWQSFKWPCISKDLFLLEVVNLKADKKTYFFPSTWQLVNWQLSSSYKKNLVNQNM